LLEQANRHAPVVRTLVFGVRAACDHQHADHRRLLARGGKAPRQRPRCEGESAAKLGPWSLAVHTCLGFVFIVVNLLWIGPAFVAGDTDSATRRGSKLGKRACPSPRCVARCVLLFLLPSGRASAQRLTKRAVRSWIPVCFDASTGRTLLLLRRRALARRDDVRDGGGPFFAKAIGTKRSFTRCRSGRHDYGIVLAAHIMAVLVSELTSNTRSASLVVPVVLALATSRRCRSMKTGARREIASLVRLHATGIHAPNAPSMDRAR
jgi:hypothetical protein